MSGGLFARALLRETDVVLDPGAAERLQAGHRDAFVRYAPGVRPLPGAVELLRHLTAAGAPGMPIEDCVVVGDSVWDLLAAQRARALGVGLLSGGYGKEELERAGAFRVDEDPADLLRHLDEVGIRVDR